MAKRQPDPIDKHVGARVRMRRLTLGMSQEKLGDGFGVSFQQVQKYEKGFNRMGSSRLHQAANILQVPVTFFFEGAPGQEKIDGKAISPGYVSAFLATPDGLALVRAYMRIKSSRLRRSLVNVVEQIAGD
jgi:transcriptional regulator with XRE-family HTH domain